MIQIPNTTTLTPRREADGLYLFPFSGTQLVKMDLLFEAGSAYQAKKLAAAGATKLMPLATTKMDSAAMSEFMDFRGIIVETSPDIYQVTETFYFLDRYADELLPVVGDMLRDAALADADFEVWRAGRRQEIAKQMRQPSAVARQKFNEAIFGPDHPMGRHATVEDAENIGPEDIRRHYCDFFTSPKIVLAGNINQEMVEGVVGRILNNRSNRSNQSNQNTPIIQNTPKKIIEAPIDAATQTSLRIGRVLPLAWDSMDYARFMLLTTLLGGYFGSRLMSNLREDKGYTYGIYARTQLRRGCIVFFITAEVAAGTDRAAIGEVMAEMERLRNEPVTEQELELVKTVMVGDFLRSVDGIFERSARFCDMLDAHIDERLTDNLREAINTTDAAQLQELAQRLLKPEDMTVIAAGAFSRC